MVFAPRSRAGRSGTWEDTPPSMKVRPSTATGGNTPGMAALASTCRRRSPWRKATALPVARSEAITRGWYRQLRVRRGQVPLDDPGQAGRRGEDPRPGERPQGAQPSETGEDVVRAQLAPDAREVLDAFRAEALPEEGGIERAGRGADQEIWFDPRVQDRAEHPDLQRAETRAPREDERNRSRTARPCHEDQISDGARGHSFLRESVRSPWRERRIALGYPSQLKGGSAMGLRIGDEAPNFTAQTTEGPIDFHQWIGNSFAVLFSHPKDFTPVCTTELGYMARIKPEFDKRGVKIIRLSVDSVDDHKRWAKDIEETQGTAPNYPMIGDADFKVAKLYDMLPASVSGDAKARTPADNATVRTVFVVGPDKKIKLILYYPMTTGRNLDEVLRVIDSIQLTAKHKVATPANWKQGQDVIISGSVNDEDAKKQFPQGWKAPKPYLRITPQPK